MAKRIVPAGAIEVIPGVFGMLQEDGCINSIDLKDRDGYPRKKFSGKYLRVGRVVLAARLNRGIKQGYLCCHTCDNPGCINPNHLWEGTPRDNSKDMLRKNRQAVTNKYGPRYKTKKQMPSVRGEKNRKAKLTTENVIEIRTLQGSGLSQQEIAEQYGVDRSTISAVMRGETWHHV